MFRKLRHAARDYLQFSLVIVTVLVALGLGLGGLHTAAHWLLGGSALLNAIPLVWEMIQDLRSGVYGVDILAATAIVTSVLLHEYWAGIVIVLMLTGGEALEDYAGRRAKTELSALLERSPTKAHLLKGQKVVEVAVSELKVGDKVVIRPGEVVPVDGLIIDGTTSLDESSLTGESLPQVKKTGQEVLSGSVNVDGAITIRATHSAKDSQFEQIIKLIKSAEASKAPFVRLADAYSIPFTLTAFAIGIVAWAWSGHSIRFLEVLVVATPCPLILGAPVALISGMSRAASRGIIVKASGSMERLAAVRTFAFDKTGTLTKGQPKVSRVLTYQGFDQSEVLALAAALEQNSNHVLAKAIIEQAHKLKVKIPKAKKVQEVAGNGLRAYVKSKHVVVGRLSLINDYDVTLPPAFKPSSLQQTAAFVAIDDRLAGVITFSDEPRIESKRTLSRLKSLGIKNILMVTGDNRATAQLIAKNLGIKQVISEALPADKIQAVEAVADRDRPVAFVGDGVNDAPVLTAADVGIALGARGSTAASESADVVIMLDDIKQVATSLEIAKRTFFIAKQSILIGIFISIGLMLVFSTGHFKPLYGALIQEVVDVIVIFNALRAHGPFHSGRSAKSKAKPAAKLRSAV